MTESNKSNTLFERKIKPILLYIGAIGASVMSIAYIILSFIMVIGFTANKTLTQSIIFALINAIVGFIIMQFLKLQGQDFAKQLEHNVEVLQKWNAKKPKKKKTHSLGYFWARTITTDIIVKTVTTAFMTSAIIYIVVEGSNDYNMLLMAFVNLLMFICFGFLSLVKAYDFYNENYIPYLEEKIDERENKEKEIAAQAENNKCVEVVEKESDKQTNVHFYTAGGSHILVTCNSNESTSDNSGSMVVDNDNNDNTVLGRSIHTGDSVADSTNICTQESISKNNQEKESEN